MPLAARWIALIVVGAVPVAWAAERLGFGAPLREPLRDLALLVVTALAEEIVFRGGLQPLLAGWRVIGPRRIMPGISAANALTSLVFAAAHLWAHPPLHALAVLPVSLLLGASLERSGRLWVPAALHVWFNLLLCAAGVLRAWSG